MDLNKFDDLLLVCQREINLLNDNNKLNCKNALIKLCDKLLDDNINIDNRSKLFSQYVASKFIQLFDHSSDYIRENSVIYLHKIISKLDNIDKDILELIIKKLLDRYNEYPFKEQVEEIRLSNIEYYEKIILLIPDLFKIYLTNILLFCENILKDNFPESKRKAAEFIIKLADVYPSEIGPNCKNIIINLTKNCKHQHNKIRNISVKCIGRLIVLPNAGKFFNEIEIYLKSLLNDKTKSNKLEVLEIAKQCVNLFNYGDLKKYETKLLLLLILGVSDPNEEVRNYAINCINNCSKNRKEIYEKMEILKPNN